MSADTVSQACTMSGVSLIESAFLPYGRKMSFYNFLRESLKRLRGNQNLLAFSKRVGIDRASLSRFLEGERGLTGESIQKIIDTLGYQIFAPDEEPYPAKRHLLSRDVCFVDAKVVSAANGARPPQAENYIAVPLVGQAGAGPGIMPTEDIESWVLVYANHHSVMRRSNLLAVEVGKESDSMEPLISPYDIVLVDRDDFVPQQDGRGIYLVREPGQIGGGMIKRVQVHRVKGETQVVFYSDNKKYGPEPPRFLDADYGDRWDNAIVGRCVWSWSDLTRK